MTFPLYFLKQIRAVFSTSFNLREYAFPLLFWDTGHRGGNGCVVYLGASKPRNGGQAIRAHWSVISLKVRSDYVAIREERTPDG